MPRKRALSKATKRNLALIVAVYSVSGWVGLYFQPRLPFWGCIVMWLSLLATFFTGLFFVAGSARFADEAEHTTTPK